MNGLPSVTVQEYITTDQETFKKFLTHCIEFVYHNNLINRKYFEPDTKDSNILMYTVKDDDVVNCYRVRQTYDKLRPIFQKINNKRQVYAENFINAYNLAIFLYDPNLIISVRDISERLNAHMRTISLIDDADAFNAEILKMFELVIPYDISRVSSFYPSRKSAIFYIIRWIITNTNLEGFAEIVNEGYFASSSQSINYVHNSTMPTYYTALKKNKNLDSKQIKLIDVLIPLKRGIYKITRLPESIDELIAILSGTIPTTITMNSNNEGS